MTSVAYTRQADKVSIFDLADNLNVFYPVSPAFYTVSLLHTSIIGDRKMILEVFKGVIYT